MKNIASKLKEARGGRRVEEIAATLGVSYRTILNWEAGKGEPSATQLSRIAAFTDRKVSWFFEGAA